MLEWDELGWAERLAAIQMLGPIAKARRGVGKEAVGADSSSSETVREWLVRHGQGPRLRELLWEPLALAALNQPAERVAADPFVRVLARLCGPGPRDAAVGLPARPLAQFYAEPARRFIEARAGQVRTGTAGRVATVDNQLVGVVARKELIPVRAVVVAVPWFALTTVFDPVPSVLARVVEQASSMASSPIVTVHRWLEGVRLEHPFVGLVGRTNQWVFDAGGNTGEASGHVTFVASGARDLVRRSNRELVDLAFDDLSATIAGGRTARLVRGLVIREPRATFSLEPGQPARPATRYRPSEGSCSPAIGLRTGLPGTIESAVLSGHRAAAEAVDAIA